jgi:hypothetical protein
MLRCRLIWMSCFALRPHQLRAGLAVSLSFLLLLLLVVDLTTTTTALLFGGACFLWRGLLYRGTC